MSILIHSANLSSWLGACLPELNGAMSVHVSLLSLALTLYKNYTIVIHHSHNML